MDKPELLDEEQLGCKVPRVLKKTIKHEAVSRDVHMKVIVAEALKEWLENHKKQGV